MMTRTWHKRSILTLLAHTCRDLVHNDTAAYEMDTSFSLFTANTRNEWRYGRQEDLYTSFAFDEHFSLLVYSAFLSELVVLLSSNCVLELNLAFVYYSFHLIKAHCC